MPGGRPASFPSFTCPNCRALYQVVKAEAGPETIDRAVPCFLRAPPSRSRRGLRAQILPAAAGRLAASPRSRGLTPNSSRREECARASSRVSELTAEWRDATICLDSGEKRKCGACA